MVHRLTADGLVTRTERMGSDEQANEVEMKSATENEMKTEGSDEEKLTAFNAATGTVIVGATAITDWTDELLEDAEERDDERAAVYLATVRPAMASARFSREEREGARQRRAAKLQRRVRELALARKGADWLETGEGARTTSERVALNEGSGIATTSNVVVPAVVGNAGRNEGVASSTNGNDDVDDLSDVNVAAGEEAASSSDADNDLVKGDPSSIGERLRRTRLRRRRTNKQKKRKRALLASAKQRRVGGALERQEQEARRVVRERDAAQALEVLEARREHWQCSQESRAAKEVARVSLVQQRNDTEDGSIAQYVGADDGLPTASMEIEGEQRLVKLDSCARYTVAGTAWMRYGSQLSSEAPVEYVEGIGGFLLEVIGVWRFRFKNVFGESIAVDACIISGCTDEFLLGVDFMAEKKANMDFGRNEVQYVEDGRAVVIPFMTDDSGGGRKRAAVRVAGRTQIAASAVTPIEVSVAAKDGERGLFIPTHATGAVLLAATLTTAHNGRAWIPAINANGAPARLPNKKELGTWLPVDEDMKLLDVNSSMDIDRLNEWLESLGDDETPLPNEDEVQIGVEEPEARELVKRLLRVYRKLTTDTSDCPPATALNIQHHIDTGTTAPIMMKRRRHAQSEDQVIEENVEKMLKAGVIEEGDGAWGFPVVLVRKKDGEVRFCIDYRALNKVTKKDVYPLPRIDETLEALSGALLFTTLDLKAGYWQILVAVADRDKTAFTTKKGLFRFLRMPFGLTNAPSTFQRMMNSVLRGLTWTTCLVYLDDIVIFTRGGIERHVLEVATVLERLEAAGMTLKLKKCRFAARSMEYLGHELSNEGVRPLQRLVTAVQEFPTPRDSVEVKRFVHLAGYYRRFVQGFGSLMAPMTKLLRKKVAWEWTTEQERAFEEVKKILTNKPLLLYPDFRLPFTVVTDASTVGLGACLMQDHGHGMQPVGYASKVNSETESKYGITELECLAVVWAIKLYRPYLYGRRFTILTDHSALKWLMTSPNLTGKLHRWALTLQEFDFDVQYRPGSTNVVADALSRAPVAASVLAAVGRRRRARLLARTTTADDARAARDSGSPVETVTAPADDDEAVGTIDVSVRSGETPVMEVVAEAQDAAQRERRAAQTAATVASERGRADERDKQVTQCDMVPRTTELQRRAARRGTGTAQRSLTSRQSMNVMTPAALNDGGRGSNAALAQQKTIVAPPERKRKPTGDTRTANDRETTKNATTGKRMMPMSRSEALRRTPAESREVRGEFATKELERERERVAEREHQPIERRRIPAAEPRGTARERTRTDEREMQQRRYGRTAAPVMTLQLTDDEIVTAQNESKLVQRLLEAGEYRGQKVSRAFGLAVIETPAGRRVILPPALWSTAFKEAHDSVWAGHLRAPHTHARLQQTYWWPNLQREVKRWVTGCQECGSRKARPREVVPPLRSIRGGDVCDRWALDVAGPLPTTDGGERFVVAAVEYVTRYAVATTVKQHTAESVAEFLMRDVVLKFGPFRELLTDGAPELTGHLIEELVELLQARQTNPVPYRPQLVGLVERFNRTWKDIVAISMSSGDQRDWDRWVPFAVYAYNSGRHSTVALSPNELMMGRKLRSPNELLRATGRQEAGELEEYHRKLVRTMEESHACAERAREREQARQAAYYERKVRRKRTFKPGDHVWMFKPPRGPKASKFVHQWMGPLRVIEPVGYDNLLLEREDGENAERLIAHVSFLVSYHHPADFLAATAADIVTELELDDEHGNREHAAPAEAVGRTATASVHATAAARGTKRNREPVASEGATERTSELVVELRRRRRRNAAGQYVLEHEVRPVRFGGDEDAGCTDGGRAERVWLSTEEYDRRVRHDGVVEDSNDGEVV